METPQVKSEIVRAIQDLPEDTTVEDAMERLYFLAKIERGLEPLPDCCAALIALRVATTLQQK